MVPMKCSFLGVSWAQPCTSVKVRSVIVLYNIEHLWKVVLGVAALLRSNHAKLP